MKKVRSEGKRERCNEQSCHEENLGIMRLSRLFRQGQAAGLESSPMRIKEGDSGENPGNEDAKKV